MHDTTIKNAKPGSTVWDDQVKGLHLRAFAGRKSFYCYFRTRAGKERKPKLGDYGILSLAKAREMAREMLVTVAEGRDPLIEREKVKQAPTVATLWERYATDHLPKKKVASQRNDRWAWEAHIKPALGEHKVADIDSDHLYRLHKAISQEAPIAANRVIALVSKMLNLAELWKHRPLNSNPCRLIQRNRETARRRYMKGEEAAKLAEILHREEATNPESVAFLYLLILSGARKGEIAAARWENLDGNVLRLPDSKTGARPVYLPTHVMPVLDRLPRGTGTITGIADPKKFWGRVRQEAGCPDLNMHDLRHSFASAALKAGLSLAQIGELLGHSSTQTTKRYAHLMEEVAQASVEATADVIERMMRRPADALTRIPG